MLTFEFIQNTVPQRYSGIQVQRAEETITPEFVESWKLFTGTDEYGQPSNWLGLGSCRLIKTTQIPNWVLNFYTNGQPHIPDLARRAIKNLFYSEVRAVLVSYADLNQGISSEV